METLIQDLRFGLRMLRKNPGFTAVAVLTLALGIGANTAIFSMLNAVVLEHLAIPHAEQLALLHWTATQDPKWGNYMSFSSCEDVLILSAKKGCSFSYPMYQRLSAHLLSVTGLAAYGGPLSFPLSLEGGQTRINAASIFVSGNFFDVMQLPAYRGRNLTASDDIPGAAPVAMLSYPMWARQFGRDPSIVGKTVILMGAQVAIVGISSPDFLGLDRFNPPDLWLPVHTSSALQSSGPFGITPIWSRPDDPSPWMLLLARLKPGLPLTQAASNLSADFHRALNRRHPKHPFSSDAGAQIALTDCSRGLSGFRNRFSDALGVLMAIVACVLLVACANLANLFLRPRLRPQSRNRGPPCPRRQPRSHAAPIAHGKPFDRSRRCDCRFPAGIVG